MTVKGGVVRRILALGAMSTMLALVGCGGTSSSGSSSGNGAATGSGGGVASADLVDVAGKAAGNVNAFTWDLPFGEPTSLDPIKAYNYSENSVLSNICESLLKQDAKGNIVPSLASKIEHPSATTWVYTIRSGVKYFSGAELSASDVVANIKRNLDPKLGSLYALPWGQSIKSVAKTGPWQVTVTTKAPNTLVNSLMVTGLGAVVNPSSIAKQGKAFGTSSGTLDCTGPFKLQSWRPGDSIVMTRNNAYWDVANRAKAAQVTFRFVTDSNALANALVTGEIDGTYEAPLTAVSRLRSASSGKLYLGPSTSGLTLIPTGNGPTKSSQLMQAFSAAIDRVGIAKVVYSGTAQPLSTFASPDASNYGQAKFAADAKRFGVGQPDLEKAKALVKESGATGKTLRLAIIAGDPSMVQIANVLAEAGKAIGTPVKIDEVPPPQFINLFYDPSARKNYDLLLQTTFSDVFDVGELLSLGFLPGSIQNVAGYSNPTVTQALETGVGLEGDARADQMIKANDQVVTDALGGVPIARTYERLFLNKRLGGAPARFPAQYQPWAAQIGSAG